MAWDRMDRNAWNNSEVFQELEKKIGRATEALVNEIEEIQKRANLGEVSKDLSKVNQEAGPAKANLEGITKSVEKLYNSDDDNEVTEKKSEFDSEKDKEEVLKELDEQAETLIETLLTLSYLSADEGDTVLAYKIERLIQELKDELDCEIEDEPSED